MSSVTLEDGFKGTTNHAEVDTTGKLQVRSISEPSSIEALDNGDQYILHSAVMNISNTNNTYVGFIENTGTKNFIIKTIEYSSEKSNEQSGTNNQKQTAIVRIRKNPTGPSVSFAWSKNNVDFGSANDLPATAVTAGFGAGAGNDHTFTDAGVLIIHDLIQCGQPQAIPLEEIKLRPGNSIGFGFQPPPGNTDIDVHINVIGYLKE